MQQGSLEVGGAKARHRGGSVKGSLFSATRQHLHHSTRFPERRGGHRKVNTAQPFVFAGGYMVIGTCSVARITHPTAPSHRLQPRTIHFCTPVITTARTQGMHDACTSRPRSHRCGLLVVARALQSLVASMTTLSHPAPLPPPFFPLRMSV
jgi:hypothetical protein